jgi:hypothetical protein
MPIEIRELIIRAYVDDATPARTSAVEAAEPMAASEQLVEACVAQVMEILKLAKER